MSVPNVDLNGKIILITGATNGVGLESAVNLARMGATVGIVGRSAEKLKASADRIRAETGGEVDIFRADLSSQADIHKLAAEVKNRYDRLDVLMNNAGMIFMKHELTVDGLEQTFALNHLGYFLLTNLLLDLLKSTVGARIISVSSEAHRAGKIDFDNLQGEKGYGGWPAYANSKLANILFTRELAKRLENTGVTANCLHPGFVATGFFANSNGTLGSIYRVLTFPMRWLGVSISPEKGAETQTYLAASPEVAGITGTYFDRSQPAQTAPQAHDPEVGRHLWEVSAELTKLPVTV